MSPKGTIHILAAAFNEIVSLEMGICLGRFRNWLCVKDTGPHTSLIAGRILGHSVNSVCKSHLNRNKSIPGGWI